MRKNFIDSRLQRVISHRERDRERVKKIRVDESDCSVLQSISRDAESFLLKT